MHWMKERPSIFQLSWPAQRSRIWGENNFEKLYVNALIWVKPSWPPPFQKILFRGWSLAELPANFRSCHKRRWTRLRGGEKLWEKDMLCWELTILPSHQYCATFRFKEHVCLVVNTSFNQGWYNLGSNWPIRSAAPDGCCSDRIRKIAAYAGCGSPLAPWWASCWQICLFMMPF